ncbi:beta-ketoacyl-ACP synthase II [Methylacidimicrobium tartarophylax]|uniref:3-oxoacyl-[acyl-carrier-protein] synthase 2 n=1 Tax=Methylacidimicrobium tartarophylax TaxID=1041768 RepID=A0A5E6MFL0_9BACT|nr:beta-ketoacyl-ACP synthase II [Methylacidimicrobium tartarophylax]VVM07787.1 3-oxoacyl-[acyl-carrier-protein] synthase II [Methylacidimicrobium tartarophylax]
MTRRVVVTGFGAVTPNGNDTDALWESVRNGRSGIGRVTAFDTAGYDCLIAGEVRGIDLSQAFRNPKEARRADRYSQLAMTAAKEAVRRSGLLIENEDPSRVGVIVGSGIGGLKTLEDQHTVLLQKGPKRTSPLMIPMMITNIASGMIAIEFGCQGPNFCVVTACATASHCIGEAWRLIRDHEAEVILAGGSEAAVVPLGLSGFANMKALSLRNDEPQKASRPFDRDRDGFVLSEGAGIVVLEELEHAKKRNASILGEIIGYGLSADASHITSPDPNGSCAARAMISALKRAGKTPEEIDYINAHATSTQQGDLCEALAIQSVFGAHTKDVPVSATKSMTGHCLGAAGAVELILCLQALEAQLIPPTINLDNPDPACHLHHVPSQARESVLRVAMSNSFGFGGHNASLVVAKFQ